MKLIKGVMVRELEEHIDERGLLCEIIREDWDIYEDVKMAYFSKSHPGVIRAWHRHLRGQIDFFTVPSGRIKVAIYDDREGSPTCGMINEFLIGEDKPMLLRIPGDCWHGFKVIGDKPAILINMPTKLYDYANPDEERLPYNSDKIPYNWT
ncbi:MAG: dTDP-4-dehydrorhamnose 3,5-epimerase family protein [Candidatus Bathyarchaeia archaeon]